jgi:hypothetical protein
MREFVGGSLHQHSHTQTGCIILYSPPTKKKKKYVKGKKKREPKPFPFLPSVKKQKLNHLVHFVSNQKKMTTSMFLVRVK